MSALRKYFSEFGVLRECTREFWATTAVNFLDSLAYFMMITVVTLYLSEVIGFNDQWAGNIVGIFTLAISVIVFFVGFIVDSMGIRKSLYFGIGLIAASRIGLAFVPGLSGMLERDPAAGLFTAPPLTADVRAISGVDGRGAIAVGPAGKALKLDAKGVATPMPDAGKTDLESVWVFADGKGPTAPIGAFAAGASGALSYWDGNVWKAIDTGTTVALHGVWARSSKDAWAVGDGATLLHWDGAKIERQTVPTQVALRGVFGRGDGVYVVGDGGTLLLQKEKAWVAMPTGTQEGLRAIWGNPTGAAYAAGTKGTILGLANTDDEDPNNDVWKPMASGSQADFAAVWGVSPAQIYAVGAKGAVSRWDGKRWRTFAFGGADMRAAWGSWDDGMFIVGDKGTLALRKGGFTMPQGVATALLLLMALGTAFMSPVVSAAVRRFTNTRTRGTGFNVWYLIMNVSAILAGFLIDWLRGPFGLESIFSFGFAMAIGCWFLVMFLIRSEAQVLDKGVAEKVVDPAAKKEMPWTIFKDVVKEGAFWRFMLFLVLLLGVRLVFTHQFMIMPKYYLRVLGPDAPIGKLNAINPAIIVVGLILAIPLLNRFNVFKLIMVGTTISALSVFCLVVPGRWFHAFGLSTLGGYWVIIIAQIIVFAIGEVIWSPRLTEYTASIAPVGREGSYMALAVLPMFLAKPLNGWLSGRLLTTYCPPTTTSQWLDTVPFRAGPEFMWLILAVIAASSPILVGLLKNAIGAHDKPADAPPVEEGA